MSVAHSFPPIVGAGAHTLILGSMPGAASLAAQQYYAHPRNTFWPIMGDLLGAGRDLSYDGRIECLRDRGVAVWDVLKLCTRAGSLDSAIIESSIETNDIGTLLRSHPGIDRLFFNGAKAAASYRRYVGPGLDFPHVTLHRLPSTSPAHASMNYEAKLDAWRALAPTSSPGNA